MKLRRLAVAALSLCLLAAGCANVHDLPEDAAETAQDSTVTSSTPSPSPTPTATPTPSPSPTPYIGPPEGYVLQFSEEFEGEQIDESIWSFETGPWPYNKELECYTRENAWLEGGALVIEARVESLQNRGYTSARLKTQDKLDFTCGYLEVRAALPTARGTWPAIWLLPSDLRYGGYLRSGEIDIAERVGYDAQLVHSTVHTYAYNSVKGNAISAASEIGRKDDGYHVYALLWLPDRVMILFDGIPALEYRRTANASSDTWPFDVPFHLILNLAVGGSWGGVKGVDKVAFPQRMTVDYVRYYIPVPPKTDTY